jgi:hypothetical protein
MRHHNIWYIGFNDYQNGIASRPPPPWRGKILRKYPNIAPLVKYHGFL